MAVTIDNDGGGGDGGGIGGGGDDSGDDGDSSGGNKKCHCQMLKIHVFLTKKQIHKIFFLNFENE